MSGIVKSLDGAFSVGNMEKISQTMDQFEKGFVNMEVHASFMEKSMAGTTTLSTPEEEVGSLMQQVADDYRLEVSLKLPQAGNKAVLLKEKGVVSEEKLNRRLANLKAKG
uniref:Uncharacterized protein n=1 Tax=Nelumbo nucifera TaxID=4432 RepID=A0A822XQV9_NELNU|nr:TPA_asm: hypothetical protein HUJ06_023004 [Nelumbo nucifera]